LQKRRRAGAIQDADALFIEPNLHDGHESIWTALAHLAAAIRASKGGEKLSDPITIRKRHEQEGAQALAAQEHFLESMTPAKLE
jgi:hypothetical protein